MSANLPKVVMVTGQVAYAEFGVETIGEDILAVSGGFNFYLTGEDAPLKYWMVYGNMESGGIVSVVTTAQTYQVNIISRDPDFRIVIDPTYTNIHAELDWSGYPLPVNSTFFVFLYSIDNSSGNSAIPWSIVSASITGPASLSFTVGSMLPVSITLDDPSDAIADGDLSITITSPGSPFPVTLYTTWKSYRWDQPEVADLIWWAGKAGGAPMPTDLDAVPVYAAYPWGLSPNGGDPSAWLYNPDLSGMVVQIKRLVGDPAERTVLEAFAIVQPGDEALDDGVAVIEALAVPGQIPIPFRFDSAVSFQVRNDFPTPAGEPAYRFTINVDVIPSDYRVPPGYTGPLSVALGHASDYEFTGYISGVRASDTLGLSGADGDLAGNQITVSHPVTIRPFTAVTGLQEIILTVNGVGIGNNTLRLYSQRILPSQKRKFDDEAIDLKPFLPYEMRCIGVCNALGLGMSLPEVEDKS